MANTINVTGMPYSEFSTIAFLDTNIILEGLPLAELPWGDVDAAGPILVLFTPKLLSEVDSKKRDGRLATIARAFNRQIGSLATRTDSELLLIKGPPRVMLGLASVSRIAWDEYDDLEQDDADSKVIAEILRTNDVPDDKKVFISQDLKPISMASRHGLRVKHVPDTWIRRPEPTKAEKEAARLKEEVTELKKNEPKLEVCIKPLVDSPVHLYRVKPLSSAEQSNLARSIISRNPKPNLSPFEGVLMLDYTLSDRWKKYEVEKVPAFAASFHTRLELYFCQIPVEIFVSNLGSVRADNLIVHIAISGGWLNDKPISVLHEPLPPRERSGIANLHRQIQAASALYKPGKHEVHFSEPLKRKSETEIHCEDFRHGHVWSFKCALWLDPHFSGDCVLSATATAANMHGKKSAHIKISKDVSEVNHADLIDPTTGADINMPHIGVLIKDAIVRKKYKEIEYDDKE